MDRRKFLETAGLLTAASAGASLLGWEAVPRGCAPP